VSTYLPASPCETFADQPLLLDPLIVVEIPCADIASRRASRATAARDQRFERRGIVVGGSFVFDAVPQLAFIHVEMTQRRIPAAFARHTREMNNYPQVAHRALNAANTLNYRSSRHQYRPPRR